MYNLIIILLTISFGFSSQIHELSGNISNFSSMSTGSLFENKTKKFDVNVSSIYSSSFIRYPANINFIELFYQRNTDNYIISTNIGLLDYGILNNSSSNTSLASDKIINFSLFNINFSNNYQACKKLSIKFSPQYLSINLLADLIYYDEYNSEFSFALNSSLLDKLNIYIGKTMYFKSNSNSALSNISSGIGLLIENYKIDIGFQYARDNVFSFGTSITIFS